MRLLCLGSIVAIGFIIYPFSLLYSQEEKLLGHWAFDHVDERTLPNSVPSGHRAKTDSEMKETSGVFGDALLFRDNPVVSVSGEIIPKDLKHLSFSIWVKPDRFDRYNEIFRQELGGRRILFSFQENGTILALGVNAGGVYQECDARLDSSTLLDGRWHHCAATFDGRNMKVFLDGTLIEELKHEGELITGQNAPCYIGSLDGTREFFHGAMDDLKIFARPLTLEEIRAIYLQGNAAVVRSLREAGEQWAKIYRKQDTFFETLCSMRARVQQEGVSISGDLNQVASRGLLGDFPDTSTRFSKRIGLSPGDYLREDEESLKRRAERIMERAMEYMPLTERQWNALTEEETTHWRELQTITGKMERWLARQEVTLDPEWLESLFSLAKHIDERPYEREAVAPYRTPTTPQTHDYTASEANRILEVDWLHQIEGDPSPERILEEIGRVEKLARRIASGYPGKVDFTTQLKQLEKLRETASSISVQDAELYFQVRRVKRQIMFANPVVDFDSVLFVDMPAPDGSEWKHETRHRLGYMAVPGARLLTLQGLSPHGHLKQLMPKPPLHGSFWRPDLSYDGDRVLFCFKPHNEKTFHLYECDIDGSNVRQLTSGIFDDLDPIYLPDGEHIAFTTTRGHTYVRCMPPTNAFVLARMKLDGSGLYLISRNNEPDYTPSILNDGRIVFTRWEYTDKPLWRAQSLWVMNPDGTQVNTLWGNQSVWPDLLKDARAIPGSERIMFTGSAHHNWFSGSIGILDPRIGLNFPDGLTKVTADIPWPESGNGPVDPIESPNYHSNGRYHAFYSPYPLSEQDFLVSAQRAAGGAFPKFVLYLMDTEGNRELIYEGEHHIFHAQPIRPRPLPPRIAERVQWPTMEERDTPADGIIFSNSVYENAPNELQGKAKHLRILHIEQKTYTYWNQRPYISTGPVVSMVQSEGVKRVLGTVPIEEDGSVAFHAPSGIALHFQLLDENYRCLQTMRSFTGVMPGEKRGCLGCHSSMTNSPKPQTQGIAFRREPREITPVPWPDHSVSYDRYVQPVLDQYCGDCHQGDGEAREVIDLTRRPGYRMFSEPYVTLVGRPTWGKEYQEPENPPPGFGYADTLIVEGYHQRDPAAYLTPKPMTRLSYKSRLVDLCATGEHYEVKVDPINLRRVQVWIDTMCPYRGAEEIRAIEDPEFQGIDWIAIRPRIKTAPVIRRPGPFLPMRYDRAYDPPPEKSFNTAQY